MSVAVDANVLVYSLDPDNPSHVSANVAMAEALAAGETVFVFPPTLTAVLRVTTHPAVLSQPLSLHEAIEKLRQLLALPAVQIGVSGDRYFEALAEVAHAVDARGKLIHDAEIVALMKTHGVGRILTADRDFLRFDGIEVTLLSA